MQPVLRNDPQQSHQVFMLQLPEKKSENHGILCNWWWLLEQKSSEYSRHDCGFQKEGLSSDITFDDLYCHLLAHILSFINSCN